MILFVSMALVAIGVFGSVAVFGFRLYHLVKPGTWPSVEIDTACAVFDCPERLFAASQRLQAAYRWLLETPLEVGLLAGAWVAFWGGFLLHGWLAIRGK